MAACRRHALAIAALAPLAFALLGLVNPALQPVDLVRRYRQVALLRVGAVDPATGLARLEPVRSLAGEGPPPALDLRAEPAMRRAFAELHAQGALAPGAEVVAFLAPRTAVGGDRFLLYAGCFLVGTRAGGTLAWEAGDERLAGDDGEPVPSLAGTWNGSTGMLARLLDDIAAGRAWLPRRCWARFRPDRLIDELNGLPVRAVALADLDGDGDLDLYAAGDAGDRCYLQMEPMVFVDASEWMGLETASRSIAIADIDGDGDADLLADGRLLLQEVLPEGRRLVESGRLPAAEDQPLQAILLDADGDGWPDVLRVPAVGGLELWRNPGPDGGAFRECAATRGLRWWTGDAPLGYVAAGDWDGDGRCDVFHAAAGGALLVQDGDGRFRAVDHAIGFDFRSGEDGAAGGTGGACFAPVLGAERLDLVVPLESGWRLVANRAGAPVDVTDDANEISEGSFRHLACVADDLTADGTVDWYTVSSAPNGRNRLLANRGYGTVMLADVHAAHGRLFTGPAQDGGGLGAATGDVDGDGAADLLLGTPAGRLLLIANDTLATRDDGDGPAAVDDQRALAASGQLAVSLRARRGLVGARLQVRAADGAAVALRQAGSHAGGGSWSPAHWALTVRRPGPHTVEVRWSDGARSVRTVAVEPRRTVHLVIDRDQEPPP